MTPREMESVNSGLGLAHPCFCTLEFVQGSGVSKCIFSVSRMQQSRNMSLFYCKSDRMENGNIGDGAYPVRDGVGGGVNFEDEAHSGDYVDCLLWCLNNSGFSTVIYFQP